MYIKELCNLDGVSGSEGDVRAFILDKIKPYTENIEIDSIGNVIAKRKGRKSGKTVMIAAHMDEVGFIISGITEKGFLEFKTVGGIDTRVIISKRVRIGRDKTPGVIAMKAVHLQEKSERDRIPKVSSLYIDIGAKDKEEAEKYVSLGDYAAFDTEFEYLSNDVIKAKAIDDRIGCAALLELIKDEPVYDTYFVFTTQEEVGLRGARIAAARIKPDIALVVESTTCSDVYGTDEKDYVTILGGGAAVSFADRSTIVNKAYYDRLIDLARRRNIKVQTKAAVAGGNDSGAIHIASGGTLCASVSLPCRYIHSPAGIASLADYNAVLALADAFLKNTDEFIN